MKTLRCILITGTVILLCFYYSSAQNSFPTPTGPAELDQTGAGAGSGGELRLFELNANGNNFVSLKAPDNIPANVVWTLPDADGGNGTVLSTNGSGTLTFVKRVNTDLSNLKAITAVNASLVPGISNSIDLGSSTFAWRDGYFLGSVGIGTSFPNCRLHVNGAAASVAFRVQVAGSSKLTVGSGGGVTIGVNNDSPPTNGLFVSGNTGIGISTPDVKLHVTGGSDAGPASGGFLVLGSVTGANVSFDDNEIMARSNGVASTLFLNHNGGDLIFNGTNATGNLGIGTSSPGNRVHVKQDIANRAIEWQHESTSDFWTVGIGTATLNCRFEFNAAGKAQISSVDGTYSTLSDARLKEDIVPLPSVLDKVMTLAPSSFYIKDSRSYAKNKSIGFISQEVEKVFPELVRDEDGGYKWLCYTDFGVLAIKAIQEQQKLIQELSDRLNLLESKTSQTVTDGMATLSWSQDDISILGQNVPNPYDNNTLIPFRLPKNCKDASLQISETTTGRILRVVPLICGETQISIDAGQLSSGTYTYSLYVDGNLIDSKQMMLSK